MTNAMFQVVNGPGPGPASPAAGPTAGAGGSGVSPALIAALLVLVVGGVVAGAMAAGRRGALSVRTATGIGFGGVALYYLVHVGFTLKWFGERQTEREGAAFKLAGKVVSDGAYYWHVYGDSLIQETVICAGLMVFLGVLAARQKERA